MAANTDKLSEAQRLVKNGFLDEAEPICRALLRNRPNLIEAVTLLGGIQCRRSDFRAAAETFTKATRLQPRDAITFRNLGFALSSAGNSVAALEAYDRAAELSPEDAYILNDLSMVLRQLGRLEEATERLQQATTIAPNLILPRRNLAEVQLCQRLVPEAIASYQDLIRRAPSDAAAHNGLGNALTMAGKTAEAIAAYELAIKYDPNFAEAENNLATLLQTVPGRHHEVIEHCRRALELRPDVAQTHERLGQALMICGDFDEALLHNEAALRINPAHVESLTNIGSIMVNLGRFGESISYFEQALKHDPNYALAIHHLSELASQGRYEFSDEQMAHVASLLNVEGLRPEERMLVHTSYARLMEKRKNYVEAFAAYEDANRFKQTSLEAKGLAFRQADHSKALSDRIAAFSSTFFESNTRFGSESEAPVFVVGMPRTGTTLVEQIIASHPQAAGVGESLGIPEIVAERVHRDGRDILFPQTIIEMSEAELVAKADRYLTRLLEQASGASRVVDKMWGNYANLGLIAILFPRATVIHCRREPMDVCLSCFLNFFDRIQWSWSLEDISFNYREYERIMTHWRDVLPLTIFDVQYEDLVEEPERVSRELIQHCGLEWNDQCLEFHKSKSMVRTASRVQVRQPIYKSSRGRWRRFEQQLKPLQETLNASPASTPI